jgi:hypothetical protein
MPYPSFMHQAQIQAALAPTSSKAQIQAVWEQFGYLVPGSIVTFNSGHFLRGALASLTTEASVVAFIDSLDAEAQRQFGPTATCTKALVARNELQQYQRVRELRGADFATAVESVLSNQARRTCCRCHETGSYCPR